MTAYTSDVLALINNRLSILTEQLKDHAGTEHEYALKAGMFELMSLGESVTKLAAREKNEIQKRLARDAEISWTLNPDTSGGAFTQEEINRSNDRSW